MSLTLLLVLETLFLLSGCLIHPQCEDFGLADCIWFGPWWGLSRGDLLFSEEEKEQQ